MEHEEDEKEIIIEALDLITGGEDDNVPMGIVLERVKRMYTAMILKALSECETPKEQEEVIRCFVGSHKEVMDFLQKDKLLLELIHNL